MKIRTSTLIELKKKGVRFAALTSYDMHTASIFDGAGIEVLLVGDSASDNVLANEGTASNHTGRNNPIWKGSCEKR